MVLISVWRAPFDQRCPPCYICFVHVDLKTRPVRVSSVNDADRNSAENSRRFTQMSDEHLRHLSPIAKKASAVMKNSERCETADGNCRAKDEEKV